MNDDPATRDMKNLEERWIRALGGVVYHFGHLERTSFWLIGLLGGDRRQELSNLDFSNRTRAAVSLLTALLRARQEEDLATQWEQLRARYLELAKRRNVIHNPLSISAYFGPDGSYNLEHGIELQRRSGLVDLEAMETLLSDIETARCYADSLFLPTFALIDPRASVDDDGTIVITPTADRC